MCREGRRLSLGKPNSSQFGGGDTAGFALAVAGNSIYVRSIHVCIYVCVYICSTCKNIYTLFVVQGGRFLTRQSPNPVSMGET